MKKINFTITGKPKGKQRPRFFRGHAVTPKETRQYEKHIKECYESQTNERVVYELPVSVRMNIYVKPPKTINKKYVNVEMKKKMLNNEIPPQGKSDIDNVIKIVLDGLQGVAFKDDIQVYETRKRKWYSVNERVEVELWI